MAVLIALGSLIKQLTEAALAGEIDSHLAQDLTRNRKNGYNSKTMKSDHGSFELDVPRDRNGSFEPEIVKKNQTTMTSEIEKKMLSLYAIPFYTFFFHFKIPVLSHLNII